MGRSGDGQTGEVRDASWRSDPVVYEWDPERTPGSVYVHVPFCFHRCGYCDFTLVAGQDELIEPWLTALSFELDRQPERLSVQTIYLGGGTPTHLSPGQLARLLEEIGDRFRLTSDGEYSVEANPDGLSDEKLAVLAGAGVNRISLGVQSFDEQILRCLERTHSPDEAAAAVGRAAAVIPNVSIDLIFGVPGQTGSSWATTLRRAVDLPIRHVSAYGLTFEKGTDFFRRRRRGEFDLPSPEQERDFYERAMDVLPAAGFGQYEISSFARTGFCCRHNQVYWDAREYFGFGPGAARYLAGVRSTNSRNTRRWIESWLKGRPALQEREQLGPEDRAREAVMLGLRQTRGIDLERFAQRFGYTIRELSPAALDTHLAEGLLQIEPDSAGRPHLSLTRRGRFVADSIVGAFL